MFTIYLIGAHASEYKRKLIANTHLFQLENLIIPYHSNICVQYYLT
jgi:hypothetical protein